MINRNDCDIQKPHSTWNHFFLNDDKIQIIIITGRWGLKRFEITPNDIILGKNSG